uniref:(northern house mosquito) hypothetical protein n=1 Tax=Culex pipiens TaxID=7175 RepID=A0A8D8HXK3_CULPI
MLPRGLLLPGRPAGLRQLGRWQLGRHRRLGGAVRGGGRDALVDSGVRVRQARGGAARGRRHRLQQGVRGDPGRGAQRRVPVGALAAPGQQGQEPVPERDCL